MWLVNWRQGDDCIIVPAVTAAEVYNAFPKGYRNAASAGHAVANLL